jgi:hypothetical protein
MENSMNETTLLEYAKAQQRELWQEAELRQQARIARARTAQHQEHGVSTFRHLLCMWGFGMRKIEQPVTPRATA